MKDHRLESTDQSRDKYVIIFFHGYGSGGVQMLDHVGNKLMPQAPGAVLRCPEGPQKLAEMDGASYHSWFDIQDILDAPSVDAVAPRAAAAADAVNKYIDDVLKEEGIDESRLIIAGFSQGATMAFYAALMRDKPVAGVYSLSGGALRQIDEIKSKPPVALLAGEHEQGDYSGIPQAKATHKYLDNLGFRTDFAMLHGQGHDISDKAVELLAKLAEILIPAKAPAKTAANDAKAEPPRHRKPPRRFKP